MNLVTGQFNEAYDPIVDGVTVATRNYALWLNRSLGPCWVVAPGVPGHKDQEPFGVVRYPSLTIPGRAPYRFGLPWLAPGLKKHLDQIPFDLVHAHSPFSAGRLALRQARRRGIPIIGTFHSKYRDNFEQDIPIRRIVDWQVRQIVSFYQQLDEVWVPSQPTVDVLRGYGFDRPIEVVSNGTDFAETTAGDSDHAHIGSSLGIEPREIVFLYVGQLIWEKNLELLIEALGLVHAQGRPFRMVFVGEGYARHDMERKIRQQGFADSAIFTGVIGNRQDIGDWYRRADALLFPSIYDTYALVVREAASFAVPAVLTRGSIPAEEIEDGKNGFLADNTAGAFAALIGAILDKPESLRSVGEAARSTLPHTWHEVLLEVRDRYLQLTKRGATTSTPR